jgi:hypothetical protein
MKKSEFRNLIREEARKTVKEVEKPNTDFLKSTTNGLKALRKQIDQKSATTKREYVESSKPSNKYSTGSTLVLKSDRELNKLVESYNSIITLLDDVAKRPDSRYAMDNMDIITLTFQKHNINIAI